MPYSQSKDADLRLVSDSSRLTPQEVRDLLPWMRLISEGGLRRLYAELALQHLEAIQQFDRSASTYNRIMVVLTAALVVFTAVLVVFTWVLTHYTILLTRIGKG